MSYPGLRRAQQHHPVAPQPPPRRRDAGPTFGSSSNVPDPRLFQSQCESLIPAEVRMISGCHSEQTSADVANVLGPGLPNQAGKAGGACTSSLLEILYANPKSSFTFQNLLLQLRESLASKGFGDQIPQLSSSRPLELRQTPFSLRGQETNKALLVGINYRGQEGDLSGCQNDVLNVRNYLVRQQGYDEKQILMLMDDGQNILPTRQKIISALQQLVTNSEPGDHVYFHYSGHGGLLSPQGFNAFKAATNSNANDYEETLYPVDHASAGQIRDISLFHHFVQPMVAGVLVTCVMDCCHSGTVLNLPHQFQPTPAGLIQSRQSSDALGNLAFLHMLAGNTDLATLGGGIFENVIQQIQNHVGGNLESHVGSGLEELYNNDQTDDSNFTTDIMQFFSENPVDNDYTEVARGDDTEWGGYGDDQQAAVEEPSNYFSGDGFGNDQDNEDIDLPLFDSAGGGIDNNDGQGGVDVDCDACCYLL